jgi:MerR family mercuric resistance operon transcriptional regulator
MVQSQELRIGAVARLAGVSIDTVRYYERRDLLRPAGRLPSGYRLYTDAAVARIRLARQLQGLGMTLEEVAATLSAHDAGGDCASERWRLEAARERVVAEQARLAATAAELDTVLAHCAEGHCDLLVRA